MISSLVNASLLSAYEELKPDLTRVTWLFLIGLLSAYEELKHFYFFYVEITSF